MRVRSRFSVTSAFVAGVLAVLVVGPDPAIAQCGMMGGGGHDHGGASASRTAKPSASEKKLRRNIDVVMADERGRALLAEALLNDRAFMEALVRRMVAIPEWRAMAARQLATPEASGTAGSGAIETPVYTCPMHREVAAAAPGVCPKCGMDLVRRPPGGQ